MESTMQTEEFKQWRVEVMQWTQEEAAQRLGITRRAVLYYEHGERRIPQAIANQVETFRKGKLLETKEQEQKGEQS